MGKQEVGKLGIPSNTWMHRKNRQAVLSILLCFENLKKILWHTYLFCSLSTDLTKRQGMEGGVGVTVSIEIGVKFSPFLWVSENCSLLLFLSEFCLLWCLSEIWLVGDFLSEIWRSPEKDLQTNHNHPLLLQNPPPRKTFFLRTSPFPPPKKKKKNYAGAATDSVCTTLRHECGRGYRFKSFVGNHSCEIIRIVEDVTSCFLCTCSFPHSSTKMKSCQCNSVCDKFKFAVVPYDVLSLCLEKTVSLYYFYFSFLFFLPSLSLWKIHNSMMCSGFYLEVTDNNVMGAMPMDLSVVLNGLCKFCAVTESFGWLVHCTISRDDGRLPSSLG